MPSHRARRKRDDATEVQYGTARAYSVGKIGIELVVSPNTAIPPDPPTRRSYRVFSLASNAPCVLAYTVSPGAPARRRSLGVEAAQVGPHESEPVGVHCSTLDPRRAPDRGTRHRPPGLRGSAFAGKVKELPTIRLAFFTEIFKLKDTIVLKVVPQIVLAAVKSAPRPSSRSHTAANDVELRSATSRSKLDGHLGVSVVLSKLLVFEQDRRGTDTGRGESRAGRRMPWCHARCPERRVRHVPPNAIRVVELVGDVDVRSRRRGEGRSGRRATRARSDGDFSSHEPFVRVRSPRRSRARHGYSDVGPVTDDELMTRDRGGKPRVPDIVKDKAESEEFRARAAGPTQRGGGENPRHRRTSQTSGGPRANARRWTRFAIVRRCSTR